MAIYTTEAVIIGVKNFGDADKIITLLSPDNGKITASAFGCRRPKNALAGVLQLFNVVDIQLNKGTKLDTVRSCTLKKNYKIMSTDFNAMAYGAFVAELAGELSVEDFPQVALYKKLRQVLDTFGKRNPRLIALIGSLQFLKTAGVQLSLDYCVKCSKKVEGNAYFSLKDGGALCTDCHAEEAIEYPKELRRLLTILQGWDLADEGKFKINGGVLMQAENIALRHIHNVLGKQLKTLEFLQQL